MPEQAIRARQPCPSTLVDPTGDPIMLAKFRFEPPSSRVIPRSRLFDLLCGGVSRPVTLVTAPAGAGKTTLVSSWASEGLSPGPLTWISLDDGDERPGMFWSYLLEGLSRSGISVSNVVAPSRAEAVDQSFLVRLSAHIYGRQEPVVIVLDDADVLAGTPVLNQIDFLLRHSGPQLRIVFVTRVYPGPTLHRHRLAGTLTTIGLDDLAFTEAETRTLLRAWRVSPTDEALTRLISQTRGWATGLVLAAAASRFQRPPTSAVATLAADPGDLADYFNAEVIAGQPPEIRRFMVHTSVLAHLRPALVEELTGRRDADRTLRTLARAHTFLAACSEHADCYRYHPLFAELLGEQLKQESPAIVAELHRTAATWFQAAGSLMDGVHHAAAAGDWTDAAGFIVERLAIGELLAGPDSGSLADVLAKMPKDADDPASAAVAAALAVVRQDLDSCSTSLSRVQALTQDAATEPSTSLVLAISLVELVLARTRIDVDGALVAAARVEAVLDELACDGIAPPVGTRSLILFLTGGAMFSAGLHEQAAAAVAKGLEAAGDSGCERVRAACLGLLALIEAVRGRLSHAADLGHAAKTSADQCGLTPEHRPVTADVALAWVCVETSDCSSVRADAERSTVTAAMSSDPVVATLSALVHSGLRKTAGDTDGALAALRRARMPQSRSPLPGWLDERLRAATAALHVSAGRPEAAISSIMGATGPIGPETAVELARADLARGEVTGAKAATTDLIHRRDLSVRLRIDVWLLRASCALELGDESDAEAAVKLALKLAEPEHMRRPFIQAPAPLRRFIRGDKEIAIQHRWLGGHDKSASNTARRLPALPSSSDPRSNVAIVEPLSVKEQEVLGHLAALLTTEEIAMTMFVSVNTVKTHVRGILRKLAASRRNEAVRRARDLQLL